MIYDYWLQFYLSQCSFNFQKEFYIAQLTSEIGKNEIDPKIKSLLIKLNWLPFVFTKFSCQGHPSVRTCFEHKAILPLDRFYIVFVLDEKGKRSREFLAELEGFLRSFKTIGGVGYLFQKGKEQETYAPGETPPYVDFPKYFSEFLEKSKGVFQCVAKLEESAWLEKDYVVSFIGSGAVVEGDGKGELDIIQNNYQNFIWELEDFINKWVNSNIES